MAAAVAIVALSARAARADEGQWTPDQIAELDRALLKSKGLEIEPRELWSERGGLMRATISLAGCSAAFVSESGLIATNHHCAYRAIQAQSSPENDLLAKGFLARKGGDELEAKGYTAQVLDAVRDVTAEVRELAGAEKDDHARFVAIDRAKKRLILECEKKDAARRCTIASFYLGREYRLFESVELKDIRLVYAPPAAIGEYGGEIDNWMWPRHTGDFALLRAYAAPDGKPAEHAAANTPYKPAHFLHIGHDGVQPGDFVAVLGYPGVTNRYLFAREVERQVSQVLPALVDLYGEWIATLEAQAKRSPSLAIKVAGSKKSFANRHKNARGMIAGVRRLKLADRRKGEEAKLGEWAKAPERAEHAQALVLLAELSEEREKLFGHEFLLETAARGPNLLALAIDLVRRAREREKPDLERKMAYMDRNASLLWKTQERRLRDFDPDVDARLLASLVVRAHALEGEARIEPLARLAAKGTKSDALGPMLAGRFRASKLNDPKRTKELYDSGDAKRLARSADPIVLLARELATEIEAVEKLQETREGRESRVGPRYFEMLKSVRGGPIYPDANGTLRFSFASVKGYEPEDGMLARAQTTLEGALSKHTGVAPFDLPQAVRDKASVAKTSYWADPQLGDLPLCFLSNADTTGGNSGSPIINGRGELVGLNFDRVWENIAGDFGYSEERSRNIGVDIRYPLFLLDRVDGAGALMRELGVGQYRAAPARSERATAAPRPSADPIAAPVEEPGPRSSCAIHAWKTSDFTAWPLTLSISALVFRRRRSGRANRARAEQRARAAARCDRDPTDPRDDGAR